MSLLERSKQIANGNACVYATGSFGRLEASEHSDLDIFILGKNDDTGKRMFSRLNEICIKADLIRATQQLAIPEFSGDGLYLQHFTLNDLTKTLGTPQDDLSNTFTARLLLLLESRPILGAALYNELINDVIAAYWGDYQDHSTEFMPAFVANDILRLWRTFCVNYEARTKSSPDKEKAKRKLKNYKLKHSRLLTCYSALLFLLGIYVRSGTVTPNDAIEMIKITPTERLRWLAQQPGFSTSKPAIQSLLTQYENFLATTNMAEEDLVARFLDRKLSSQYIGEANTFGDKIFEILNSIGTGNPFHRILVV